MKRLQLVFAALLCLSGCSYLDVGYDANLGVVDRAMLGNLWLNSADTSRPVAQGIGINDALVVTMDADLARLWDLRIAQFNGASVGAAIAQATLATAVAGIAIGQGPVAAAGGVAATSIFLQHVFGIANTPAKANAYLGGKELLVAAENEYWLSLQGDGCGKTLVSGTELTPAGANFLIRISNAQIVVQKQLQMTIPTLEQMQAATADQAFMRARRAANATGCVAVESTPGKFIMKPRATIP